MAVPANPLISDLVTEGLRRGGRVNPSAADITNATSFNFNEVLTDIRQFAPRHSYLLTQDLVILNTGQSIYPWPVYIDVVQRCVLWAGPTQWQGVSPSGGTLTTITVQSSMSVYKLQDLQGKFIAITAGTGTLQWGQIINWDGVSTITVDSWRTGVNGTVRSPDATANYYIMDFQQPLFVLSKPYEWNRLFSNTTLGTPLRYAIQGRQFYLDLVPDQTYLLIVDCWIDLTALDQASTLFGDITRLWRDIFIQGIAVKTMQRFNDDRYQAEFQVYQNMLSALNTPTIGVVEFRDVGMA